MSLVALSCSLVTGLSEEQFSNHAAEFYVNLQRGDFDLVKTQRCWEDVPESLLHLLKSFLDEPRMSFQSLFSILDEPFFEENLICPKENAIHKLTTKLTKE
jgi:hypothetical protein